MNTIIIFQRVKVVIAPGVDDVPGGGFRVTRVALGIMFGGGYVSQAWQGGKIARRLGSMHDSPLVLSRVLRAQWREFNVWEGGRFRVTWIQNRVVKIDGK